MSVVTVRQLLEAGVHFGHQTRRWNPKMQRYIFGERNGIYILDLQQTVGLLEKAYKFVEDTVAGGGTVLFVGTKKQAQEAVEQQALRVGMPFVNFRWLGGMLTNFETIKTRLARLRELEDMVNDGTIELLTKKEGLLLTRELDKLQRNLGGIRTMTKLPSAVWIVDTVKEHIAVTEANRLGIPVVAVVDTNCDPDVIDYVIPGNDDAIRSGALLTHLMADACAAGYSRRASRSSEDVVAEQAAAVSSPEEATSKTEQAAEPLAEWEIALQQEEAASAAAAAGAAAAETAGAVEGADAEPVAVDAPAVDGPADDAAPADDGPADDAAPTADDGPADDAAPTADDGTADAAEATTDTEES
jgi:small subunit ribosomal protein S2